MSILKTNKIQNLLGSDALDLTTSGSIFTTPSITSGPSLITSAYFYSLNAAHDMGIPVAATFYSMFGVGINLSAGTYCFEIVAGINTAGTNAHTTSFNFGGTSIVQETQFYTDYLAGTAGTVGTPSRTLFAINPTTVANGVISPSAISSFKSFNAKGIIKISTEGTLNPQIGFSVAPGTTSSSITKNSYISIMPISTDVLNAIAYGIWI